MDAKQVLLFFPSEGHENAKEHMARLVKARASNSALALFLDQCHSVLTSDVKDVPALVNSVGSDLIQVCNNQHAAIQHFVHVVRQVGQYLASVNGQHGKVITKASRLGALGLSLGAISASVIAGSENVLDVVRHGVQAARFAFFMGLELSRTKSASDSGKSCAFIAFTSQDDMSYKIDSFNKQQGSQTLYISTVGQDCVEVSGPADILSVFQIQCNKSLAKRTIPLGVCSLLHHNAPASRQAKQRLLQTAQNKLIFLPSRNQCPLRSTMDGRLLDMSSSDFANTLADMIMLEQNRMDLVAHYMNSNTEPAALLWSFGSDCQVPEQLFSSMEQVQEPVSPASNKSVEIAIIGMGCRLPKSNSPEDFWKILKHGMETMEIIPDTRFKLSDYFDAENKQTNKMPAKYGHFIDAELFDSSFFNISPREATNTDPQQRVFLHVAYEALENAGYNGGSTFDPATFGCYVGVTGDDYRQNMTSDIDAFYCPGGIRGFVSGKVSYFFKWSGPSIVFDTACASGLTAIHYACQALKSGECKTALAGGANLITSPEMFIGLSRGHFISNTGGCKSFDETADGYCRADGVAALILKPLEDAIRDNDNVLGVIMAHGGSHSGTTHSITHPHTPTIEALFRRNCDMAGIKPSDVTVVEAHSAGTQAGDPAELKAITGAFGPRAPHQKLYVSSLKPNIGHCEAVSGLAGVIKSLLMLKHNTIPPHIGIKTKISSKLVVPAYVEIPLQSRTLPDNAVISVNNFGAPGNNFNVMLRANRQQRRERIASPMSSHIVTVSAKSSKSLGNTIDRYTQRLQENGAALLQDISYTTTARRLHHPYRMAVVGSSITEIVKRLKAASETGNFKKSSSHKAPVVFCFSGTSSYYSGMGKELYATCPVFKTSLDQCSLIIQSYGMDPTTLCLSGFSVGYALAKTLQSWGIEPEGVVGHGLGEYVAAVIAQVMTVNDALWLLCQREQLIETHIARDESGLLSVKYPERELLQVIARSNLDVEIACVNGPVDIIVAGDLNHLVQLQTMLKCKTTLLDLPYAYHSSKMSPMASRYLAIAKTVDYHVPRIPLFSNLSGGIHYNFDAEYYADHLTHAVRFKDCVTEMLDQFPNALFVDVGAHPTCMSMIHSSLPNASVLSTLQRGTEDWSSLNNCTSQLYMQGIDVDWTKYHKHNDCILVDMPSIAFDYSSYWIPYEDRNVIYKGTELRDTPSKVEVDEPKLIATPLPTPLPWQLATRINDSTFEIDFSSPNYQRLIRSHQIQESGVACAAIFVDIANVALAATGSTSSLGKFRSHSPVTESTGKVICRCSNEGIDFVLADGTKIATLQTTAENNMQLQSLPDSNAYNRIQQLEHEASMPKAWIYRLFDQRGVAYDASFQGLENIKISQDETEASAIIRDPSVLDDAFKFSVDPTILDSIIQAAGFVVNMNSKTKLDEMFVVNGINAINVPQDLESCQIYVSSDYNSRNQRKVIANAILLRGRDIVGQVLDIEFVKLRKASWSRILSAGTTPSTLVSTPPVNAVSIASPHTSPRPLASVIDTLLHDAAESKPVSVPKILRQALPLPFALPLTKQISGASIPSSLSEVPELTSSLIQSDQSDTSSSDTIFNDESVSMIREAVATELGVLPEEIRSDANFTELGLDSILVLEIVAKLKGKVQVPVTSSLIYANPSLQQLHHHFRGQSI